MHKETVRRLSAIGPIKSGRGHGDWQQKHSVGKQWAGKLTAVFLVSDCSLGWRQMRWTRRVSEMERWRARGQLALLDLQRFAALRSPSRFQGCGCLDRMRVISCTKRRTVRVCQDNFFPFWWKKPKQKKKRKVTVWQPASQQCIASYWAPKPWPEDCQLESWAWHGKRRCERCKTASVFMLPQLRASAK